MKIHNIHRWKISVKQAKELQSQLSGRILQKSPFKSSAEIQTLAACDIAYASKGRTACAVCLVYSYPGLKLLEKKTLKKTFKKIFPYVPGYLSFREAPVLLELLKKIKSTPDVILVDGQGIAHPRGLGLASHLGLFLETPVIGCAKSLLCGDTSEPPPGLSGGYTFIKDISGSIIGMNLRTRMYTKPVYVSVGHKIDLEQASDIIMGCVLKCRIPEPLRQADLETKKLKKGGS